MTKKELIAQFYKLENEAENFFTLATLSMVLGTVILALTSHKEGLSQLVMPIYLVGTLAGSLGLFKALYSNLIKEDLDKLP